MVGNHTQRHLACQSIVGLGDLDILQQGGNTEFPFFVFASVSPESCPPFKPDNASLFIGKNAVVTPLVQGISL